MLAEKCFLVVVQYSAVDREKVNVKFLTRYHYHQHRFYDRGESPYQ